MQQSRGWSAYWADVSGDEEEVAPATHSPVEFARMKKELDDLKKVRMLRLVA